MTITKSLLLEALYKYFPNGFPGIKQEVLSGHYRVLITKDATPLVRNTNLFIWDESKHELRVTENIFPDNEGMGTFCTSLWIAEDGRVLAYALYGCDIQVDPPTGKLTAIFNGRPW